MKTKILEAAKDVSKETLKVANIALVTYIILGVYNILWPGSLYYF